MEEIRFNKNEEMLCPKVILKASKSWKEQILGYCKLLMLFVVSMIISCEQYNSEFYHPDKTIYFPEGAADNTIEGKVLNIFDYDISDMKCNGDNIIFQIIDSTLFKVYDIKTGEIYASFANIGHAKNEFETLPKCSYKNSSDKNKLYVVEYNGLLTKVIDLQKSIQSNTCVVSNVLKHPNDVCEDFYATFFDDNGVILFNKDVSYHDPRDNIFYPPTHGIIKNGNTISSNVFPKIIVSKITNNIINAYANRMVVSPNKKFLANVFILSDIINIYDVENNKDIALLGSGVNDFAFFQTLKSEKDILDNSYYYHLAACGSDRSLFVLKTLLLHKEYVQMVQTDEFSGFHQELVIYDWNERTFRKVQINHMYPIFYMDYEESSNKLYTIDSKNQLVEFDLNTKS